MDEGKQNYIILKLQKSVAVNRRVKAGKQHDIILKLQKSDAVNRGVEGGQQLTFQVSEVCRFAFLSSENLPVLHRPRSMVSHVSSLLLRARCLQWLKPLRPVTSAKSQVMHLGVPMTVLCGECLVRVVGSGLRRGVQSQVRCAR